MDFHCLEALLGLPEFCVIDQVLGPQQLALHLERRDPSIVCPRCQTCCSQVKESRPRGIRDWLLFDSRVVDMPIAYNPTFVMLSFLKSLFFNGFKKTFRCLDNVGAQDPG